MPQFVGFRETCPFPEPVKPACVGQAGTKTEKTTTEFTELYGKADGKTDAFPKSEF